jgi:hypothetical protein
MQTRLQAQAAGVLYNQPAQMAALGPDAVRNPIHCVQGCLRFEFDSICVCASDQPATLPPEPVALHRLFRV